MWFKNFFSGGSGPEIDSVVPAGNEMNEACPCGGCQDSEGDDLSDAELKNYEEMGCDCALCSTDFDDHYDEYNDANEKLHRGFFASEVAKGRNLIIGDHYIAELSLDDLISGCEVPYVCSQYWVDDEGVGSFIAVANCASFASAQRMVKFLDSHVES